LLPETAYDSAQVLQVQARFQALLPERMENAAVVVDHPYANGMRAQITAVWGGTDYLYGYVLFHERDDAVVVLSLNVNSQLSNLLPEL
jgi:hypothetical protein